MWINDIEEKLPNGLHDSILQNMDIDFVARSVTMTFNVDVSDATKGGDWVGKKCLIKISDVDHYILQKPNKNEYAGDEGLLISNVESSDYKNGLKKCSFFIVQWNSFIEVCGKAASVEWYK